MESLSPEVAPVGIRTMLVEPGFFRTELLTDPAKLAKALVRLASEAAPPLRWPAGADAVETFEKKARDLLAQADAHRELSSSLAYDGAEPGAA
jgi:NAD(P)-dependent dehydrogenase (short-subunit alcohol dehydrogenase family)